MRAAPAVGYGQLWVNEVGQLYSGSGDVRDAPAGDDRKHEDGKAESHQPYRLLPAGFAKRNTDNVEDE